MIKVKICGLSTPESVAAAARAGADLVGFVTFPKSPRHIEPAHAAALKAHIPHGIPVVSVLVDPDDALLREISETLRPDYIQLHGSETAERLREIKQLFGFKIIKAVKVATRADIEAASRYYNVADMLMFDATPPKGAALPGGNGIAFDWELLKGKSFPLPWFLSGGLSAENVASALRMSGAQMVDVSSGVEVSAGVKDEQKIESFIKAAKA